MLLILSQCAAVPATGLLSAGPRLMVGRAKRLEVVVAVVARWSAAVKVMNVCGRCDTSFWVLTERKLL